MQYQKNTTTESFKGPGLAKTRLSTYAFVTEHGRVRGRAAQFKHSRTTPFGGCGAADHIYYPSGLEAFNILRVTNDQT